MLMITKLKTRTLDEIHSKHSERDGDLERILREREEELEISKSAMDQALLDLHELQMVNRLILVTLKSTNNMSRMVEIRTRL